MRWLLLVAVAGCTDRPSIAAGTRDLFQVTRERVPNMSLESFQYGVDVTGDGTVDNQLGAAFATMAYDQLGDPQTGTDAAMSAGQLVMTIEVQYAADRTNLVNVTSYTTTAAAADPPPTIADPLVGSHDGHIITAGPGSLQLVVAPFGTPVTLTLEGAHIQAFATGNELNAVVGGGVDPAVVRAQLLPQWAQLLTSIVARDCPMPGCMCGSGTPGALATSYFDGNRDCAISDDELESNSLIQSELQPDVTIDGTRYLSFGVALDATIEVTVP